MIEPNSHPTCYGYTLNDTHDVFVYEDFEPPINGIPVFKAFSLEYNLIAVGDSLQDVLSKIEGLIYEHLEKKHMPHLSEQIT